MNKIITMCGIVLGLSCTKDAPVANQEQAVEQQTVVEPVSEVYNVVQPIGVSYAEVWSNAEQLRLSVFGKDVEGNKQWELRWSRFENISKECLFEQFYAKSQINRSDEGFQGLWEIVVTDMDCNGSVDFVVESFNSESIKDETTMEGINEYMASARASIFNAYPLNLEAEIGKWHERNAKKSL
ncbi:MAG: hypothetical protein WC852_06785 [Candidatus Nanoarchaeia archaeon]|jgi:hypothetical protein